LLIVFTVSKPSSNQAVVATPEQVVQGYLQALADGDASKALSYSYPDSISHDTSLLNDSVLAASNQMGPIQNIHVSRGSGGVVEATYTIGTTQVSTNYMTVAQGGSGYAIRTYALVSMPWGTCTSSFTINGQLVACGMAGTLRVFPGTYEISGISVTPNPFRIRFPDDTVDLMPG